MRWGLRAAQRLVQQAGAASSGSTAGQAAVCSTSGREAVQEMSGYLSARRYGQVAAGGRQTAAGLRPFESQQQWAQQRQRLHHSHQQRRLGSSLAGGSSTWLQPRVGHGGTLSSGGRVSPGLCTPQPWAPLPAGSTTASAVAAAAAGRLPQVRGLLGKPSTRPVKINYQDHNQKKPKRIKIKTRSVLKRRIIVDKEGTFWRTQAGRRHKRYKKTSRRLAELRGMVPLAQGWARKLRKLGYKRRWWYSQKA